MTTLFLISLALIGGGFILIYYLTDRLDRTIHDLAKMSLRYKVETEWELGEPWR